MRIAVPIPVRHGYIRTVRTGSAVSTETNNNQCAVRWQMTKASMMSALISRSRARHIRKFEFVSCPLIVLARKLGLPKRPPRGDGYSRRLKIIAELFCRLGELSRACRSPPARSLAVLAVPVHRTALGAAESIGLGKSLGRQAAGIRAVAAPIAELLKRQIENPAGGIGPAQALLDLEGLDVGQPAVPVAL